MSTPRHDESALLAMLTEQNKKLDNLLEDFHKMEIHIAELKAVQTGNVEKLEYRVGELEAWKSSANRYLIGLVIAFLTSIVVWAAQQIVVVGAVGAK